MSIKVITTSAEMQNVSNELRLRGRKIGFVPTMGYLHQGHLSLIQKANELADVIIVSIFVNPTQFSPNEDLEKYPRDFVRDRELLIRNNVDYIFYPGAEEIYPKGFQTYVETQEITKQLEGSSRPEHFRGVTTVVNILFNIVKPHFAVFGQKDAQQAAVIKRMVSDLHIDTEIIVEPIVREGDGLAMSSRNFYLSSDERKEATVLFASLLEAKKLVEEGVKDSKTIIAAMKQIIESVNSSSIDYINIVQADSFEIKERLIEGEEYFVLIACRIGRTRLIDNILITAC